MGDDQLRDEVLTLLLAGHETSANALAWTLHELSRHPEVQDAAAAEARAVAGDGPVTAELSRHLPLIDRILRESLRLHPPAWILSRRLEADEELGGELLPKGTYVFCPPYLVHRNPRHWPDPSRFDPDRFLQEPPAHAWIPFGDGPRRCIGEHFAMMELRIVLATWLRRARFLPGPGEVREDASVTLRPRGGLTLRVARRPM
jgi:cytochrome P450